MKEFECTGCKTKWYSAATTNQPCERCGGVLSETTPFPGKTVRRFQLITNEKFDNSSNSKED